MSNLASDWAKYKGLKKKYASSNQKAFNGYMYKMIHTIYWENLGNNVWRKWMDKGFGKKRLANWHNVVLHVMFVCDVIMTYQTFTCE